MVGRLLDETDPMSATARGLLVSVAAADTRSIRAIPVFRGADGFEALADAERRGLLVMHGEQIGFANPLMRSALYQAASPEERRLAHARSPRRWSSRATATAAPCISARPPPAPTTRLPQSWSGPATGIANGWDLAWRRPPTNARRS